MERKKRPKNLRGGKGTLTKATSPAEKIRCRNHDEEMKYDPLIMGWACPVAECNYRRYKRSEVDQYGPPLICEGPFTLTLYKETDDPKTTPRVLLRGSNNVVVDLSSIAQELNVDDGTIYASGPRPAPIELGSPSFSSLGRPQYSLSLLFGEVTILTESPKT